MSDQTLDAPQTTSKPPPRLLRRAAFGIFPLIFLADVLFYGHAVGLSLILFSAALTAVAIADLNPRLNRREWTVFGVIWIAAAAPLVEYLQFTSVVFLVLGHGGLLIWCALGRDVLRAGVMLPIKALVFVFWCIADGVYRVINVRANPDKASLMVWVLPIVLGGVFLALFIGANPVFGRWWAALGSIDINPEIIPRVIFWTFVGVTVLPYALFKTFGPMLARPARKMRSLPLDGALLNAQSVTISLILFNLMFAAQNVTDLSILWGGAALPEGMTYATYAHAGAYPLMVTSILAMVFALICRPFLAGAPHLKTLLLVWVAQNMILVASALLRLDLYVDIYGLTYLRLRAGIGMGLVVVGMALLIWQVWRGKSNGWLTGVFAAVTVAVIYTGSFVNWGYVIADHNVSTAVERKDSRYLCRNAYMGVKALIDADITTCWRLTRSLGPDGWRDWSYRSVRLEGHRLAYLAARPNMQSER